MNSHAMTAAMVSLAFGIVTYTTWFMPETVIFVTILQNAGVCQKNTGSAPKTARQSFSRVSVIGNRALASVVGP
jgi:hypothetical protein